MAVSQEMQNWVAEEINERLEARGSNLRAESRARRYAGGWRSVSVDVHINTQELGLVLALDPKHLQSRSSIDKNWKNMLNDLVAFSGNLHSRFPNCVVGGVVGFEIQQTDSSMLDEMYDIVKRVAVRERVLDPQDLMEGFAIVVYDCGRHRLVPDIPPINSPLRASNMFERVADLVTRRYVR